MAAQTIRWAGMRLTIEGAAEFRQKLNDVNNQLKTSQAEMDKVVNSFGRGTQNIATLTEQQRHLTESIYGTNEKLTSLNMALEDVAKNHGVNSEQANALRMSIAQLEAEKAGLIRRLEETSEALRIKESRWTQVGEKMQAFGKRMQDIGGRMSDIGSNLSRKVTAPLVGIGTAAIALGSDFESSMGNIQARTGMAGQEVGELSSTFRALALSGDYGTFSARQIANAFGGVAVAGQDAEPRPLVPGRLKEPLFARQKVLEHATELMRASMVLSTAVGKDLGSSAYFLGNYLLKVGKDASYTEKYINLFASANQRTQISLSTLQDYLFRANAALGAANISGVEATATFGKLYQAGVRGANAYSGFQQAIETMLLPTDETPAPCAGAGFAGFLQGKKLCPKKSF